MRHARWIRSYIRTLQTFSEDFDVSEMSSRAVESFHLLVEQDSEFNCSVGQLVDATSADRVRLMYVDWKQGRISARQYTDALSSALARLRVEQGM